MTNKQEQTFGEAAIMGVLRNKVEEQLLTELWNYKIDQDNLVFDWSDSAAEGAAEHYMDGELRNFSDILIYDPEKNLVAEGWMAYILDQEAGFFLPYWDYVTTYDKRKILQRKEMPGIPKHIWKQIPEAIKPKYSKNRLR